MRLVIGVPTKGRAAYWYRGLLVDSLKAQTDLDFELVICDDSSRDWTQTAIREVFRKSPFRVRLHRLYREQTAPIQDSALTDNVLFQDAIEHEADIFLHLDDDGFVDSRLVEFIKCFHVEHSPSGLYGHTVNVSPRNLGVIGEDPRREHMPLPIQRMNRSSAGGALWSAPVTIIRDMGGHDMDRITDRAGDGRFGDRLAQETPLWFATTPEARFFHLGHSTWRMIQQGQKPVELERFYRAPQLGDGVTPAMANGGAAFWLTRFADSRLLWSRR